MFSISVLPSSGTAVLTMHHFVCHEWQTNTGLILKTAIPVHLVTEAGVTIWKMGLPSFCRKVFDVTITNLQKMFGMFPICTLHIYIAVVKINSCVSDTFSLAQLGCSITSLVCSPMFPISENIFGKLSNVSHMHGWTIHANIYIAVILFDLS